MNIESLRAETPGCKTKVHFNNAGSSLPPFPVVKAMTDYLTLEAETGGYELADLRAKEVAGYYDSMAMLLNASPENIAFTSSATSSFSRALSCISFKSGDTILIANEDYISNQLVFLSLEKRFGTKLLRAKSLPEGGVDLDDMKRLMDNHRPALVSVSHTQTNSGLIQPAEAIGKLCRERDIPYLVDACQSAGQLPVDVKKLNCDFLTGTFRKFLRGPRGAGFLFVSDSILKKSLEPLFIDMRGADWKDKNFYSVRPDAKRFEEWEFPYALVIGSKVCADYAMAVKIEEIQKRNAHLGSILRKKLSNNDFRLLEKGKELSSIITINIPGKEGQEVMHYLRNKNINTSVSYRDYGIIDFDAKGVQWALRISPHYYNTEAEIDLLVDALRAFK